MAIANARYFVQSSNGFSAYAVDHNGRTYAEASGLASLSTVAQSNSRKTFYTYAGEWLTVFGGVCCAVIFLQNIRTAYRSYHKKSGI
jgi:apolipoprotein N-acyltransferase